MSDTIRWGVVGTMDEPAPLILAWAAHHLALGAAEAHVFLDRPNPQAQAGLAAMPGAFVTVTDAAYWANSARGRVPPRHTARQKHNATQVYATRRLDWLLHCDADEYLQPTGDFLAELAATDARTLRVPVMERVRRGTARTIFDGTFRGALRDAARVAAIYGDWAPFLAEGMAGHCAGKEIVRGGEAFAMGIHSPVDLATKRPHRDGYRALRRAVLLHFDGLTPLHILTKLLKRATEPVFKPPRKYGDQRVAQFTFVRDHAGDRAALQRMLDHVFGLSDAQARALGDTHLDLDFLPGIGADIDISADRFDDELRQREAELIRATGLRY